jgi:hypothetical protein
MHHQSRFQRVTWNVPCLVYAQRQRKWIFRHFVICLTCIFLILIHISEPCTCPATDTFILSLPPLPSLPPRCLVESSTLKLECPWTGSLHAAPRMRRCHWHLWHRPRSQQVAFPHAHPEASGLSLTRVQFVRNDSFKV